MQSERGQPLAGLARPREAEGPVVEPNLGG
jgi:hypothetical protein